MNSDKIWKILMYTTLACTLILFTVGFATANSAFDNTNYNQYNIFNVSNFTAENVTGTTVNGANQTMFDALISNFNSWITSTVSDLVNYFTKTEINNLITGNFTSLNESIYNAPKNWSSNEEYPAACPANYFATQIGDSITCTEVTNIPNGENATFENLTVNGGVYGDFPIYGSVTIFGNLTISDS